MLQRGFVIKHGDVELELKLEAIQDLKLHEEIVETLLKKLKLEVESEGVLKHPIIVDRGTLVVLDGMHRVEALRRLGYAYIPACLVNYESPSITLGSWARLVEGSVGLENLTEILKGLKYEVEEVYSFDEVKEALASRSTSIAIITRRSSLLVKAGLKDIKRIYDLLKIFEEKLRSQGFTISYETEDNAYFKVKSLETLAALIAPAALKNEVISKALGGELFVHKSTRHIIPARPLFINVPLKWLTSRLSLEEAKVFFHNHLLSKKLVHYPPGRVLNRYYEEDIYVFKD